MHDAAQDDDAKAYEEFRQLAEPIVGVINPVDGMTQHQRLVWARHLVREADNEFIAKVPSATRISDHWLVDVPEDAPEDDIQSASASLAAIAYSTRIVFDEEEGLKFMEYVAANPMNAFAGPKTGVTSYPSPNMTFDLRFAAGKAPIVTPRFDVGQYEKILVRSMWIHCIYDGTLNPRPNAADAARKPDYLRWAQIVAGVKDAVGNTYTFAGVLPYDQGGAAMFPVKNSADFTLAHHGRPPAWYKWNEMSHMSQFVCSMTTYLIRYFKMVQEKQRAMSATEIEQGVMSVE